MSDEKREMITVWMRCDQKAMAMKAANKSPMGNLSAYVRDLIIRDLQSKGYLDARGDPVQEND